MFVLIFLVFLALAGAENFSVDEDLSKFSPEQVHLTFSGSNPTTQLVVTWTSFEIHPVSTIVNYGPSSSKLIHKSTGTFFAYSNDYCKGENRSIRSVHTATFDVSEGQTVYYRLSGSNGLSWSDVFVTTGQSRSFPQTVALWGDMGVLSEVSSSPQVAIDASNGLHQYHIHLGDTAYNMDDNCGQVGDDFLNAAMGYVSAIR